MKMSRADGVCMFVTVYNVAFKGINLFLYVCKDGIVNEVGLRGKLRTSSFTLMF